MTTKDLEPLGFLAKNTAEEKQITGGFCGDLLSWAMSRIGEGQVWFTVMGNINAVAVANLADAAAIVLCHDAVLAPDAAEKAQEHGINIYATSLPEYEAA
ncbi:MAG: hypothetical protein PHG02_05410, partial [Oscillospiraceae bacterium]|nr:hypothetical protein [Oscillospiraceae bacterium]